MWPEARYDAMTSGSPRTVHTLAGKVDQSMTGVADRIDLVRRPRSALSGHSKDLLS